MSGWRDSEGHTAKERRKRQHGENLARLAETARRRPLSLLKSGAVIVFVGLIVAALLLRYF